MYDQAIVDLNKAIEINPKFVDAYYNRGIIYYDQHKYDFAIADYTKAIEIDSNFAKGYCNRGAAYYDKGLYNLAIADGKKFLELAPHTPEAESVKAIIKELEGKLK